MSISTAAKIGIGAIAAWLGYAALAPKPRFLGDRLELGDLAIVDLSFVPELRTFLLAASPGGVPDGAGMQILVDSLVGKDSFGGRIVGAELADGRSLPLPSDVAAAQSQRTLPRASVVAIRRGGRKISS